MTGKTLLIALLAVLPLACAKAKEPTPAPAAADPAVTRLTLLADPGDAMSVLDAKQAAPRAEIVVVGRIDNIVKGYAVFNLVDESLAYCNSSDDATEDCSTPWDYCCIDKSVVSSATLTVEVLGSDGKVRKAGALQKLRLLDLVAVKGTLVKDEHGNITVQATGWFRRARPMLSGDLHWPE